MTLLPRAKVTYEADRLTTPVRLDTEPPDTGEHSKTDRLHYQRMRMYATKQTHKVRPLHTPADPTDDGESDMVDLTRHTRYDRQ